MRHNLGNDFSLLIDHLVATQPSTILDIGVGTGINGLIAREILEYRLNVRRNPRSWLTKIDAILNPAFDGHAHLDRIYNQVHIGRPQDIIGRLSSYDLILIRNCLEHINRADALNFLEECMMHTSGHVIAAVPIGKFSHVLNPDHPWFCQSSYWYVDDFEPVSSTFEILDSPVGPSGIFIINKEEYISYRTEDLSQAGSGDTGRSGDILQKLQITRSAVDRIDLSDMVPFIAEKGDLKYFSDPDFKEHYRLIAYLSTRFDEACIFDIGTNRGYSALALSYNSSNRIISYDIENLRRLNRQQELTRIEFKIGDVLDDERLLSCPLIMLDTNHDGSFEDKFYRFLKEKNYGGLLFLDDIHLCAAMIRVWNHITEPKVDLTDVGHFSGSGLVDFSKKGAAMGRDEFSPLHAIAF